MYIKSFFKYQEDEKDEKEYKKLLKPIISLDLRKISKFSLLALYGSSKVTKDIEFDKNLSIYVATNSACIDESYKSLHELKNHNSIMPFNFLNINTNNTGFYISKALDLQANSYTISANNFSFEKALELAYNDFINKTQNNFLIGFVESSSCNNALYREKNMFDNSSWLYIGNNKNNSIAKLKKVKYFKNIKELNNYLVDLKFNNIVLNNYAKEFLEELQIDKSSSIFEGDIFFIFENNLKNSLYIALNEKKRAYVFYFNI